MRGSLIVRKKSRARVVFFAAIVLLALGIVLVSSEAFSLADGGSFAIQCRPRLVVNGAANVKSDDTKRAERSALCTRDGGRTVDVVIVRGSDDGESPGPSLFALSRQLVAMGC